jgi:hypothetical protein
MARFDQSVDMSDELLSTVMEKYPSLTSNVFAQLSGAMKENGVEDICQLFQSVEIVLQMPEVFSHLHIVKLVTGGLIGVFFCAIPRRIVRLSSFDSNSHPETAVVTSQDSLRKPD